MEQSASGLPECSEIPARSGQARHPSPCDRVTVQSSSPRVLGRSPRVLGRWRRHTCGSFLSPTYFRSWDLLPFLKDASDAWMGLTSVLLTRSLTTLHRARAEGVGLRVRLCNRSSTLAGLEDFGSDSSHHSSCCSLICNLAKAREYHGFYF